MTTGLMDSDELSEWVVNYLSDPTIDDPYPMLASLRRQDPVHHSRLGPWVVTRYSDVDTVSRDQRFSRFQAAKTEMGTVDAEAQPDLARALQAQLMMLINRDEPAHIRIRMLLQKAFTPKAIETWKPRIRAVVRRVVDDVSDEEEFDLLRRVGYPIPEIVICELMGVPHEDHALWGKWAAASVARSRTGAEAGKNLEDAQAATLNLFHYFEDLVRERRANPGDDLASVLIRAEEDGERLNNDELIGTLIMLITAGHETTANMIGNGMYTLLRHPEQYRRLVAEPSMVPSAVDEMLRFEVTSKIGLPRVAVTDIDLAGTVIPQGARVIALRSAANRDPAVFDDPDTFDIGRSPNKHISFGVGIHYCLGVMLARTELNEAFDAVARRLPDLELVERPTWRASGVRSLNSLMVRRT